MRASRAFTIVELMVTVFIIALLLSAAVAGIVRARQSGRDAQRMRDVASIATAVDQVASANRGKYPTHATAPTTPTFCAHELGTPSANPNNINFGLFLGRVIPTDPLPELTGGCTDYRYGYIFHGRVVGTNNLARPVGATAQNYEYVIEVGLERDVPAEEAVIKSGGAATASRRQFLLTGRPCAAIIGGNLATGSCTVP